MGMTPEQFVEEVRSPDPVERLLVAASIVASELEPGGIIPVVVGGSAVEFYTRGAYLTIDIDLILPGSQMIDEVLKSLGFQRTAGASYIHPVADVVIDLPKEPLEGDPDRITQVVVKGRTAYIIGLEDAIVDRLRAAAYWADERSREWATHLMAANWEEIDWLYLEGVAAKERPEVARVLAESRALAFEIVRENP